jgi:hypothetical protein
MRARLASLSLMFVLLAPAGGALAYAQDGGADACRGETVSRVDIRSAAPPFEGSAQRWRAIARAIGLHHATTRPSVIEAFLALHVGEPCTELRRAESERILRAQPFIADAKVAVVPDSSGGVAVIVETTDEIPVLIGGRMRGLVPDEITLGNANVGGMGLRLEGGVERGRSYNTGLALHVVDYAAFARPYTLTLDAERRRVGHFVNAELEHPFFTDLQRISWHVGRTSRDEYVGIARPARDELALQVRDESWDVSGIVRIFGTGTVALLGAGASGRRISPAMSGIVMSDSGFVADTGVALRDRYIPFRVGRIGLIGGVRRVRFQTVTGFDALAGSQDVASGVMAGLYAAHGLASLGERDAYLSGAVYAGFAGSRLLLATMAQAEARRDLQDRLWDSMIGSSRTALYVGSAPGVVFVVDDELSAGRQSHLPLQLRIDDAQGGIIGYHRAALAGAVRNVARAEMRFSFAAAVRRADLGFATFAEAATLWAGDVPYGTNATRGSVGVSLLAAYPSRSKRLYRVDLGIPLTRAGEGGGRIELRFRSEDRTRQFWREPDDVSRARTGAVPSTLFAWPTR